ncbi:uncharacterized protein Z518_06531 [Rhinocladiella mackenziei CBS 650.93]|uniref:DUF221 domain protein n=1 Tax=Rhinocladiella mackenziei CBS 650.93 TaxID=1442369 RepID=A0A0D2II90_9EURO|nr:uncharacterized protein Z518_06531 [Rhinocladiella mackenziei CBS 650.93]KIX02981.1 hypothetical protein Z518_06531 [Rhinocladiella mackenziei CBS 650.93]
MEEILNHVLYPRQSPGGSRDQGSNSLSGIISTLVPTLVIATVAFSSFLFLRTRCSRVYCPRTDERILDEENKTPRSGAGFFTLLRNYSTLPDAYVLQHNSLDGYLWLRFFKILIIISFVGCCITWPVLFPVNATGGGGQKQLDQLSMSNVDDPNRYYAHALIAWVFLGFVVLLVARERINLVGLRRAYFLSPAQAQRLSSRTILVLGLPHECTAEKSLRQAFGSGVRKIWLVTDCGKLEDAVKNRNKTSLTLENAEMKLNQDANARRLKSEKNQFSDSPAAEADPTRWMVEKKRPSHRLKPQIWKKVDTINWSRGTLSELKRCVQQQQNEHLDLKHTRVPAAFIEFSTQSAAQYAYQCVSRESMTEFAPRYIGIQPEEVVWKNLSVSNASRRTKLIIATCIVSLMILLWTIPVAVVGALSNINYLTNKVHFLSFINDVPDFILGVITGLLPAILLAILMALVPVFCGLLARLAGEPTLSAIELKTQSWYFAFQVIQVFLITTFTSGKWKSWTRWRRCSAPTLLATNLPKASNFYISYFILFGLAQAALQLLNIVPLLMYTLVGKFLDKTPRKRYNRFINIAGLGWGSSYPKFTNLGVIAIAYAGIAPLIMGFSTIGFCLLYLMFRYNFLFVLGNKVDLKGEAYSKALKHLLTGVYLAALCLIGLFAVGCSKSASSSGPLAIMVVFLVVLIAFQFILDRALVPLEQTLPLDLLSGNRYSTILVEQSMDKHQLKQENMEAGTSSRGNPVPDPAKAESGALRPKKTPVGLVRQRIEPLAHKFYESNKAIVAVSRSESESWMPTYTSEEYERAYLNPAITCPAPVIWLAKDQCGVSRLMVQENREAGIESTDNQAELDEKNKLVWQEEQVREAPLWERAVKY